MTRAAVRLAFVLAASTALGAQAVPVAPTQRGQDPAPSGQPAFRAVTDLVVVDVSATGRDGTPVRDLKPDEFVVKIDGRPRRVASIKFVDQAVPVVQATQGVAKYSSNQAGPSGRLIVILVDQTNIRFGGMVAAAQSIEKLLTGFGASDRIALATLPGPRTLVDFTTDRSRISAAIKRVPGSSLSVPPATVYVSLVEASRISNGDRAIAEVVYKRECSDPRDLVCPAQVDMEVTRLVTEERNRVDQFSMGLRSLFGGLQTVDAPKIIVLFSEGFASPEAAREMTSFAREADAARATVYTMRLDRSMFDASRTRMVPMTDLAEDRRNANMSLEVLAGATRGSAFEITGSADLPFKRLAAEVSGYYLLGVEPEGNDRDGKSHPIRVDVNRPGVSVRFRAEVTFRRPVTDDKKRFEAALTSPLVATDLPIRVATFTLADDDPTKVRLLVSGELDVAQPKDMSALIGFVLRDEKNNAIASNGQRVPLTRTESGALSFVASTVVPPGKYVMKLAAVHAGQVGSVDHEFSARLSPVSPATKAAPSSVRLGDVVVMAASGGKPMLRPPVDGHMRGDAITGLVQVGLDQKTREQATFVFDVVKAEDAPALLSVSSTVDPRAKRTPIVEGSISTSLLPPGDYGMRVSVSIGGAIIATAFSPFFLERTPSEGRVVTIVGSAPSDVAKFRREDVLEPQVVAPFLDEVARLSPPSSRDALEHAKSGRFDEAVERTKTTAPNDPSGPFLRGLALLSKGQLDPAANSFRAAVDAAPELLVGSFYIGACFAAGGNETKAVNAWQMSLIGLKDYPAVYRFIGDSLIRTGQWERARTLMAEASARWPDDPAFRSVALRATIESGHYDEALDSLDQALERRPNDTDSLFLAMRTIFEIVFSGRDPRPALLPRLERYRDAYVAAGGPRQALVAEWVAFVQSRAQAGRP